jgi:hypothetical protein
MIWTLTNPRQPSRGLSLAAAPTPQKYTTASISTYSLSAEGMASLGFEAIANLKVHTDVVFLAIDVVAYVDAVEVLNEDDQGLYLSRMGMGFRVALAAWGLSVDASVNLGAVAAAVQVKNAQSNLDIQVFADDVLKLPGLQGIENLRQGTVNAAFINELSVLAVSLTAAMTSEDGAKINPAPVKIARIDDVSYAPYHMAVANRWAIEQVRRRQPLVGLKGYVDQRPNYQHLINPAIVAAAYSSFGIEANDAAPTDAQVDAANRMQPAGW